MTRDMHKDSTVLAFGLFFGTSLTFKICEKRSNGDNYLTLNASPNHHVSQKETCSVQSKPINSWDDLSF